MTGAAARVAALNDFLYREEGFAGNRADYYDARNSFLNEVLERRTGIPITLAIVYTWVARAHRPSRPRASASPATSWCAIAQPDEILVDPFTGELVSRAECEERLRATAGEDDLELDPSLLEPTPTRQILARVLRNLKQIWLAREEWQRALGCAERILLVAPRRAARAARPRAPLRAARVLRRRRGRPAPLPRPGAGRSERGRGARAGRRALAQRASSPLSSG